mmetsp:Transcript_126731/g.370353  ORF Transcript_126731/g.370353 Transcript_126731/m.370353 type:complete len:264 (+) Transcript_126731:33-824(+)
MDISSVPRTSCRAAVEESSPPVSSRVQSKPLVFLDIDGVMLPFGYGAPKVARPALFPDCCLHALSEILSASGALIVLSSTWRASEQAMEELLAEFQRFAALHGGPLQQVLELPLVTDPGYHGVRQHEIWRWLQEKEAGGARHAWVALDDEPLLEGRECCQLRHAFEGHVVQTLSHEGLRQQHAEQAIALLAAQCPVPRGVHAKVGSEDAAEIGTEACQAAKLPCQVGGTSAEWEEEACEARHLEHADSMDLSSHNRDVSALRH